MLFLFFKTDFMLYLLFQLLALQQISLPDDSAAITRSNLEQLERDEVATRRSLGPRQDDEAMIRRLIVAFVLLEAFDALIIPSSFKNRLSKPYTAQPSKLPCQTFPIWKRFSSSRSLARQVP